MQITGARIRLSSHVDVGPVSMPIRTASSRCAAAGCALSEMIPSQSALMTEANAKFKRLLT
jgi:hypothetical protein